MKNSLLKTNLFLLLLLFTIVTFSCKNSDFLPDNSIVGSYKVIDNPVLCVAPTMLDVKIKAVGTTYNLIFTNRFTSATEELSGIRVEKNGNTSKLFYEDIEMGEFTFLKYDEWLGGIPKGVEGMVLLLKFSSNNKHYEFMGRR